MSGTGMNSTDSAGDADDSAGPHAAHEGLVARAEHALRDTVHEAEEAAWETAYEAKDLAHDMAQLVTHPGHEHKHEVDQREPEQDGTAGP